MTPTRPAAPACAARSNAAGDGQRGRAPSKTRDKSQPPSSTSVPASATERVRPALTPQEPHVPADDPDAILLAPNVLSVRHWSRIGEGLLLATSPRVDWAKLLRRSFNVDALVCPRCHGRLRVLVAITEEATATAILASLRLPTAAPPLARARDPTDDGVEQASGDD